MEHATEKIHIARKYAATKAEYTNELHDATEYFELEKKSLDMTKNAKRDAEQAIDEVKNKKDTDHTLKSTLDKDISSLDGELRELTKSLETKIANHENTKNNIKDLSQAIEDLEKKTVNERERNEKQETNNDGIENTIKKLKIGNRELDADIQRLKKQTATLTDQDKDLNSKIQSKEKDVKNLRAKLDAAPKKQATSTTSSVVDSRPDKFNLRD